MTPPTPRPFTPATSGVFFWPLRLDGKMDAMRRTFPFLSSLSLVLCVGLVVVWPLNSVLWFILFIMTWPEQTLFPNFAVLAFPVALTAILPALWLFLWWRRRRQHPPGHCQHCGYDLRASAGECPECGEPIPTTVSEA